MALPFRHSAGFGKRIKYWIIGRMLKESMDVYVLLTSAKLIRKAVQNKNGKNTAPHSIGFNRTRSDRQTGERTENMQNRYKRDLAADSWRPAYLPTIL